MQRQCLICNSGSIAVRETIQCRALSRLWQRHFQIDVSSELSSVDEIDALVCNECKMIWYEPSCQGGPKFYERCSSLGAYYQEEKVEFELVAKWGPSHGSVLDVGAGVGNLASWCGELVYTGLEHSRDASQEGQARGRNVLPLTLEEYAASASKGTYDMVCFLQVLEHLPDPAAAVSAALGLLRGGGRLVVSVPNAEGFPGRAINGLLNLPPHHCSQWRKETLSRLGSVFEMNVLCNEALELESLHAKYAGAVEDVRRFYSWMGWRAGLVDDSWRYPLAQHACSAMRRIGAAGGQKSANGHTLFAVYEKRKAEE